VRRDDGNWVLNGEKMWISNGGFADLIVVFAKVDGEQFTAFLVERAFPGVSSGNEEHKMGLHGSSTTPILLQDAIVPAENVLGEIGRGHKVALNTLNYGRFSLGAMCTGGAKGAIGEAVRYAASRRQFGQPIAAFGAIRHKLGEMIARTYAAESLVYRMAGLIDEALAERDTPGGPAAAAGSRAGEAIAAAFEQFAVETASSSSGTTRRTCRPGGRSRWWRSGAATHGPRRWCAVSRCAPTPRRWPRTRSIRCTSTSSTAPRARRR
jgi:alkylation response protein AidB-like acyl-CoA dehydrogenase